MGEPVQEAPHLGGLITDMIDFIPVLHHRETPFRVRMAENMTPEEEGSDVREMVWEMSRMTNKILIWGIILILAILAVLMY